jgi:hypothetical protein
MATVTAHDVKDMWVIRVRAIIGDETYELHLSSKWNKIFHNVANLVNARGFDLRKYIDVQLRWAVVNSRECSIWPTLLSGQKALERYLTDPQETTKVNWLREIYQAQYEAFNRVCETVSEEAAFTVPVLRHEPLFSMYMHYERKREPSKELVERAILSMEEDPLVAKVLPEGFLAYVEQQRARYRS